MTMEESPPRSRRKKMAHKTNPPRSLSFTSQSSSSSTQSSSRNHGRFTGSGEMEINEECSVKCTGQRCRACSAALVADCVALCCCPLAVISILALAFIKVPYAMGKRCFGRRKRRETAKKKACSGNGDSIVEGTKDIVFEFGEDGVVEQRRKSLCTGFVELDNVLLELYQVGHLGFGRVSFTGIQPNSKAN